MALFRDEALRARERAWLGRIVLARPLAFSLLTALAAAFAVALGLFLSLTEYTRKARVTGVLAPEEGVVRVVAQQGGRVDRIEVREGEPVARGAPLATISDPRVAASLADPGSALAQRMAERERALELQREFARAAVHSEQQAFGRRRAAAERELRQLDHELSHHEKRLVLASAALERARHLALTGFVSIAARDREDEAMLEASARLEGVRRARMGLVRELTVADLEAAASFSRGQGQLAALDTQLAALRQERVERELQFRAAILAPASGIVSSVLVEPGQSVGAGATLATLIPEGARLEAHLFSPSRSIGFVQPGQEVLLRYLAYPHQKFGSHRARIAAVSRNPLSPAELALAGAEPGREPLYRIKAVLDSQSVAAYGAEHALQPGMQLEADVLLDRRRLVEWIFEPLLGLAGRT